MFKIEGTYNSAMIFAEELEKSAIGQIRALCNMEFMKDSILRIMPDAHAGSGCVIGTTMTISNKVVPNLVGVDIGCGMEVVNIGRPDLDFRKLDCVIRDNVPSGFALRNKPHRFVEDIEIADLTCIKALKKDRSLLSVGTLGGGNHFIEIDHDKENDNYYLIIHSGSRNPGLQVANIHQKLAAKGKPADVPYELAYVEGQKFDDYVHDMKIMQTYASINRKAIADEILKGMKWKALDSFSTIHNYLDTENMILRKGAVSAQNGERLLIPLNMRDGSIIATGLGNPYWNYSAPHGAGRRYSRKEAKENLTLTAFKTAMEGIYSTSVNPGTIDESPDAYKSAQSILDLIGDTVRMESVLKPVYNFKAAS